jgi:succinate dehydrogenase/fumarate reductase cytochrome b subunit
MFFILRCNNETVWAWLIHRLTGVVSFGQDEEVIGVVREIQVVCFDPDRFHGKAF